MCLSKSCGDLKELQILEVKRRQHCWAVALFKQENKQHDTDLHQQVRIRQDCPE